MAPHASVTVRTVLRPPAALRRELDAVMARTVRPTIVTGAVVFALVLALDAALVRPPIGLLILHVASLGFFLAAWGAYQRWRVPASQAAAVLYALALVGLANCAVALLQMPVDSSQVSFATLTIGCGIILLSWRWLAAAAGSTVVVWALSARVLPASDRSAFLVTLLVACILSALLVFARRQGHLMAATAHAQVAESERRWRQLVENAPDRIVTVDLDGRVLFVNHVDPGTRPDDIIGRTYLDFVAPDDRERIERVFDTVRRDGVAGHCETRVRAPDGRQLVFKSSIGPLFQNGALTGFMVIATDITQDGEIERLKSLDAFKTQFINTAAHEIGTPLTPIRLQLHLLRIRETPNLTPEGIRSLDIVDRNVTRLGSLLGDVLDAARLDAGRMELRRAPDTDLALVVREAVETFAEQARASGVALDTHIDPALPLDGDAKRLSQVVFNFLSNALKFTPEGGRVRVTARRDANGEAHVLVEDTGPGIPPDKAARLFQPFTQVHETSRANVGGTGLGLFISRGIVEKHGGRIWVESRPGAGSTFGFAVPTTR